MSPGPRVLFVVLCAATLAHGQERPLEELLRTAPSGVIVWVGSGDAASLRKAASGGTRIFHILERDPKRVPSVREALDQDGLSGLCTVEPWAGGALPFPDHLANLAWADDEVSEAELLRVLVPGGQAALRKDGVWTTLRKPRSREFDEWTHWRHDADGNMVSQDRAVGLPTGLRWVAGPPQDAGGKKWYYDHALVSSEGRNFYEYEGSIIARDAYNGTHLWTRGVQTPLFKETGVPLPPNPTPKMKLGLRTSKVRPVAWGERVYLVSGGEILALEARTGQTAQTLGQTREPRELLFSGGCLIVTDQDGIRAFDPTTPKLLWQSATQARRIVSDGTALFLITARHLVSIDRATGKELWRIEEPEADLGLTLTAHERALVLEKSTLRDDAIGCGIKVYSTGTGELLWTRDYKPDMTHYKEARAYFAQGLLWLPVEKEGLLGLDPRTGSQRRQWTTRGKHCASPVATERFFLAPECEATDLRPAACRSSRPTGSCTPFPSSASVSRCSGATWGSRAT
jgi:outer membrane protein assembly factor BamB